MEIGGLFLSVFLFREQGLALLPTVPVNFQGIATGIHDWVG